MVFSILVASEFILMIICTLWDENLTNLSIKVTICLFCHVHVSGVYVCRMKLAKAVTDRMMTYHILREELMKTEDETRGRELQHAWQCLNKRKPKSKHDDSTATETSTASSEMFSDERMEKLKQLLNNPLSHLITKNKCKQK